MQFACPSKMHRFFSAHIARLRMTGIRIAWLAAFVIYDSLEDS